MLAWAGAAAVVVGAAVETVAAKDRKRGKAGRQEELRARDKALGDLPEPEEEGYDDPGDEKRDKSN